MSVSSRINSRAGRGSAFIMPDLHDDHPSSFDRVDPSNVDDVYTKLHLIDDIDERTESIGHLIRAQPSMLDSFDKSRLAKLASTFSIAIDREIS